MQTDHRPPGRRERAKQDKRERIMLAAKRLFARHGVGGVTTQQIADAADVAIGTLYLYASTKAELLIMVQNQKFAEAIDDGLAAAQAPRDVVSRVMALITPVVTCVREHPENGRTYLHELVFGDPTEPFRRDGLALAWRLEEGVAAILRPDTHAAPHPTADAPAILARVISAIMHVTTTATIHLRRPDTEILADIRAQISAVLIRSTDISRSTS
ncbi:TetR/AcrR family transcriptional regulator [Plantibacter sp. VKM Ac-2880]|uniref:TetR/AcrR family transcriptional regulator n=1 Tax=Plantibacter sp. VKM Ac-2880 TaxID=2783827 RepID=UPI00188EA2E9|nr:TetR/AcrR family transcriptional regulator [Plantibacter sp. VKM Ac-2880]MBF4567718.1 TetR/AcrR family transcriptional regulator [Plantibacter sp. VKM Ac-2880]